MWAWDVQGLEFQAHAGAGFSRQEVELGYGPRSETVVYNINKM